MRLAHALAFAAAVAASMTAPAEVRAGDGDEAAAKSRFDAGTAAFASGDYDTAVEEFRAAYARRPYPDLLVNIAQCYERIYQPDRAREHYERFLDEAPEGSALRPLADKRLRVLRRLPGTLAVETTAGAAVELVGPGELRKRAIAPVRFPDLPPGDYHLHITLADHEPVDEDTTLRPGETQALSRPLRHQVEQLTVFSVPDGARLFLDDKEEGQTPFSRSIETGRGRRLRLEAPGLPPLRESFDLVAGSPLYRRIPIPRPKSSGRTELILGTMAYGGFVAAGMTVAAGGQYVYTGTGLAILIPTALAGVAIGGAVAWALTDDNLKVGHSSILIGSTAWGGVVGGALALGLNLTEGEDQRSRQQNALALTLVGSAVGLGAGVLATWLGDPSAGDAAMVNSGGLWGTVTGVLLTEALSVSSPSHRSMLGWLTLGSTVGGIAATAVLSRWFEPSRAHVAAIDAGGLLGLVLGYGVGFASGKDDADPDSGTACFSPSVRRCVAGARFALGGLGVGLLVAAIVSTRLRDRLPKAEALLLRPKATFALRLPRLRAGVSLVPEGVDHHAVVDFLRGEF